MKYEKTPVKNNINNNKVLLDQLEKVGTSSIVWHVVKRHKFGIVVTYAIVLTIVYIFPPLPDLILSII